MVNNSVLVDFKGDNSDLDAALDESESMIKEFAAVAAASLLAVGAAFVIDKLIQGSKVLFDLYKNQMESERKLQLVIKSTGNAAGFSFGQMRKLAKAMQDYTGIADDVIMDTQAVIATFKNVKGDEFKDATKLAAEMSHALGKDLSKSATIVAKALNDPVKGLEALSKIGVSFTKTQKDMVKDMMDVNDIVGAQHVIINELEKRFNGAIESQDAYIKTTADLQNVLSDLGEELFDAVVPALNALMPLLRDGIDLLKVSVDWVTEHKEAWGASATAVSIAAQDMANFVMQSSVDMLSLAETIWNKMGDIVEIAAKSMLLSVVTMFEDIKHTFTVAIPTVLQWLVETWFNLFKDLGNFVVNFVDSAVERFNWLIDQINNILLGRGIDWDTLKLDIAEGFESSLEPLPEIAKRKMSVVESALNADIKKMSFSVANEFTKTRKKNMEALESLFDISGRESVDDIDPDLGTDREFEDPETEEEKEKKRKRKKRKQPKEKSENTSTGDFEDLEALNRRISGASAKRSPYEIDSLGELSKITTELTNIGSNIIGAMGDSELAKKLDDLIKSNVALNSIMTVSNTSLTGIKDGIGKVVTNIDKVGALK